MKAIVAIYSLAFAATVNAQEPSTAPSPIAQPNLPHAVLSKVRSIQELVISSYPLASSYLRQRQETVSYSSTQLAAQVNGKPMQSTNAGDRFSPEQLAMLANADAGTDVKIVAHFTEKTASSITPGTPEKKTIRFEITTLPDRDAQYTGGMGALYSFVRKNIIASLPPDEAAQEQTLKTLEKATVKFVVGDQGIVEQVLIDRSSGDWGLDQLLVATIRKCAAWAPAENADGKKVPRTFFFSLGRTGNGC